MNNYTPHHLQLFTGIDVQCQGASTWSLHGKTRKLSPALLEVLIQEQAIDWVKPILRSLSSMSDDECTHISKLCLNVKEGCFNHAIIMRHDDKINIHVNYYDTSMDEIAKDIVTIRSDFDIHHSDHMFSPFNQPHIFQYLIQQQFDIFNWIKDGIALDKTKLT